MPILPNPGAILGALLAILCAAIGGYVYGQHVEALTWESAIAAQKADAARIVNDHNQRMAALNLEVEHAHAQRQAALLAGAADYRRLAGELDRLRLSRRGACGGDQVQPAPGPAVPQPAPDPAGSAPGSFSELAAIADDAVATADYAAACKAWVEGLPK